MLGEREVLGGTSIMRVENHTIKGEGLRCKQPKEKARWFTDGKKTTDIQQEFQGKGCA